MKKSPIRRLRLILNVVAIVLVTLLSVRGYLTWKTKNTLSQIVQVCEIPPLPESCTIHHSFYEEAESGYIFVAFSISGPMDIMDPWLEKMDQWGGRALSFSIRESQSESRIDFSAELAGEAADHRILISQKHGTPSPPASR